jgi:predicted permease
MLTVLRQLLVLYTFLGLGFFFGRWKKEQTMHTGLISFLLVNLFLPTKVFGTFSKNFTVSYLRDNSVTVLASLSLLAILALLSLPLSRLLAKSPFERNVYRYSLTVSNYAYMGYVLAEELFGEQGLTDLILFCIPFAIYTYTVGYAMLTGRGVTWRRVVNPMMIAVLCGIAVGLTGLSMPAVLSQVLSSASACVGPLSMLLTGMTLSTFALRELVTDGRAYVFSALRLLILPLVVLGLCLLGERLGLLPPSVLPAAVMMACMPCGLNTIVFPKLVGEDCKIGARLALLTHLFSCFTIPVWLSVFH